LGKKKVLKKNISLVYGLVKGQMYLGKKKVLKKKRFSSIWISKRSNVLVHCISEHIVGNLLGHCKSEH